MQLDISVVVPVHNERGNLNDLTARLIQVLDKMKVKYEIIFVDDCSTDGSKEVLALLQNSCPNVNVYYFDKRKGQSSALFQGLKKAKGKYIITMDADLQNAPEDIPYLLALKERFDMVCGVREKRKDSFIKKFSSRFAYLFRNLLLRDGIIDTGCSLKVFKRELVKYLIPFKGMHRFLPAIAQIAGFNKIAQVSVNHFPRLYGKTKYNIINRLLVGVFDTLGVLWLKSRYIRLETLKEATRKTPRR